ncbi:hypothetical protein PtB15_18B84 [Puccinia triticina]|nr:hypothetical protein PtB15_18B84 [Puccinia triticina]
MTDHSVAVYRKSIPDGHHYHPVNHQNNKETRSMMSIRGGPPLSNTRTSLPQIQSKFDLEPNPFEQSFKDNPTDPDQNPHQPNTNSPSLDHLLNGSRSRKSRSTSPPHFSSENRLSPPVIRHTPGGSTVKVSLPGINSIASPAILVHHTGTSTPKSLSPPSLSASQPAQSSLASMPPYSWNFGGLGDSLRTGPLSPALLNGPAHVRADHSVSHTGLAPLMDIDNNNNNNNNNSNGNGTITPGTQALIAILSGNDQNTNDIRNAVGQPSLSSIEVGPTNPTDPSSLTQLNHPINLDPSNRSTSTIKSSSNRQSLGSASHRSAGPTFSSVDSTSKASSSTLQDDCQSSTSINHSPSSSSPKTQDQNQIVQVPACSRLAPVSVAPVNDSSTSPPSSSAHPQREAPSSSCIQSFMATSVGRAGVTGLHSVSSLGLTQSSNSSIGSYPCPVANSRSPFPQPPMPLTIPPAPPLQSAEIVTPLSPSSTSRNPMNSLPSGSVDRINDQYNTNPLYLLTVAHEASSRMSQLSNPRDSHHHDSMDDATATAAAALTGLGSSGGSRYSSPGPAINQNGTINSHLINNIHHTQSAILKHAEVGSSATSPRLSSQRLSTLSDSSSLPPGVILCPDNAVNLLSAHHDGPFATEAAGVHNLNGLLPQAGSSGAGSASHMQFQPSYSNHSLGPIVTMNIPNSNPNQQSFSPLGMSASKKKGKKRKEAAFEDSQKGELQSSPSIGDSSVPRGSSKVPRTGRPNQKAKKSKKAKMDDMSGDDSDSRDGYWGTEEDKTYMKQQGAEDGEFGGYSGHAQMPSNYDPDHPPAAGQSSASGKPETEEEKRKNFLERNRQAALKCRQRKKAWLANLQTKVEYLSTENESLQLTINQLREEIDSFRSILVSHKDCPITVGGGRGASTTIGELVGREPGLVAASAAAILAQQQQQQNGPRAALRLPQAQNSILPSTHVAGTLAPSNAPMAQTHHTSCGTIASSYGY